ncbi:hypothetical protein EJV47_08085 [Hymenobacter gummosus]|uniref:Uncharacterized protein n=1 Tax=Hymenobacter gummosus TaxID=1776032 RepID=A0A431U6V4_9BACT|nr:hypothetical protein [Hymenobacter gummosus]RTQ51743.1 hypothetical protein EJV47_08085 [Hymenobacter gummosus]
MNTDLSLAEMESVLLDVRRAYRLLYLYQNRVLNTVRFIGERMGFDYEGGYPWFSNNTPREGKWADLESWAWDWLNMYYYEFRFREKVVGGERIRFSAVIQSDTGHYDGTGTEGTQIGLFAPVEQSQTRIHLLVGQDAWVSDFEQIFPLIHQGANTKPFVGQKSGGRLFTKSYPLLAFHGEASSRDTLADFTRLCSHHGLPELVAQ